MAAELLVLRLVHVLGGVFWLGTVLFNTFFLLPALAAAGPAAGPVMAGLQQRRMMTALPVVAVLTMLAGFRLMWIVSGGFSAAYLDSPSGRVFVLGAVAAVLAFTVGMAVARPAMMKAGQLAGRLAAAPDEPTRAALGAELKALRSRGTRANAVVVSFLLLSGATMAVGRYF
jgi:hypothetical protein